jgi:hypothetical protein
MLYVRYVQLTKVKPIHKDKPISSERMLHKDYDRKGSVVKRKMTMVMRLKRLGGKPDSDTESVRPGS